MDSTKSGVADTLFSSASAAWEINFTLSEAAKVRRDSKGTQARMELNCSTCDTTMPLFPAIKASSGASTLARKSTRTRPSLS